MLRTGTNPALVMCAVFCLMMSGGMAQAQNTSGGQTSGGKGIPARSVGHQGARVRLPGMANPGRTLPIHRQLTLPGLSPVPVNGGVQPGYVGRPGVYLPSSGNGGVTLDGSYEDGDLSVRFHLGNGATYLPDGRVYYPYRTGVYTEGVYLQSGAYRGGYRYNPYWYYDSGRYWSNDPVDGVVIRQLDPTLLMRPIPQPAAAPAAEPEIELTAIERAQLLMRADRAEDAIDAYEEHLKEDPEDVDAIRVMGIATLEAGRIDDGTALIALAYHTDALLARKPVDLEEIGLGARRHDRLLGRALAYAKRTDAGSAHLAGVVLLQAEGKTAGATRVLDRAERAGLDADITDAFRRELGTPAHR